MLSVPVHKDVTEYQPKVVAGLTSRTILCIGAALASAVLFGVVCVFVLNVDINDVIYLVWFAAAPAALVGFYSPHGMAFEKFAPLWYAHNFKEQCLPYISASHRGELKAMDEAERQLREETAREHPNKNLKKLKTMNGVEMWEPGGKLAEMVTADPAKRQIEDFWSDDE